MSRFAEKSVLVTGASRGLGRVIAQTFAEEGARVGIGYRTRRDEAEHTLALVEEAGGTGVLLEFDVRDYGSVESEVQGFAKKAGLDILVNNAALVRDQFFAMMPKVDWDDVVAVNLHGTYHCCRAAASIMMARRSGVIVNVASVAGHRASPGQANYAASKGGVMSLTATLAAEMAPRGIRVNAVVPGMLTTGMGERLDRRIVKQRQAAIPLARFGDAREVANVVAFLASDEASYIVGECVTVDGGLSL